MASLFFRAARSLSARGRTPCTLRTERTDFGLKHFDRVFERAMAAVVGGAHTLGMAESPTAITDYLY